MADRSQWASPCRPTIPVDAQVLAVACLVLVGFGGRFGPLDARAAPGPGAVGQEEAELGHARARSVFGRADRNAVQWLANAQRLIELGRYAEAVRLLGALLDETTLPRPDDFFLFPDPPAAAGGGRVDRSLKREARALIGRMGRAAREAYELQYGAVARRMLTDAALGGDAEGLAAVSRRYFHTQAGYDATFLWGLCEFDRGRPLRGALVLDRLRRQCPEASRYQPTLSLLLATCWVRAGWPEKARPILAELQRGYGGQRIPVAAREVVVPEEGADAVVWLEELLGGASRPKAVATGGWTMFRGNAQRNGVAPGEGPLLSLRWRVPPDNPFVETLLDRYRHQDEERARAVLPGLHPIVAGPMVLMRTVRTLQAVDGRTGKRVWEVPVDDPLDAYFRPSSEALLERVPQLEQGLRLRIWADATYGTLSSDGQRVFNIEGLDMALGVRRRMAVPFPNRAGAGGRAAAPSNRLAAYAIRSGKLLWEVGGPPQEANELPLAGTFFLGPPLPLMDSLYAIAERDGEVHLVVLDPRSGQLQWQQRLSEAGRPLVFQPLRRFMGVSPSYSVAHGILLCPTSNQSIVAVDPATRALVWGYAYPARDEPSIQQLPFLAARGLLDPTATDRWFDSSIVVSGDAALVTPADSNMLYCLDVETGERRWQLPRGQTLYLACVHEGMAVLVGERSVRAVRVDRASPDGQPEPAWEGRAIDLPVGVRPSGFGFLGGDRYYLPLSSAQVMAIDVDQGRVDRVATSRQGYVPGNLVPFQDKIISQRATGVDAFWELDALRQQVDATLAADPDDPQALVLRGQMRWDEDRLGEAVDCFRRAYAQRSDPGTGELLRSALLDGLEREFARYRERLPEIESLVETPEQRARLLRLLAAGLAEAGEPEAALDRYFELVDLDWEQRGQVALSRAWSVRQDRLIQGRLARLREAMAEDPRQRLDQLVEARFEAALAEDDPQALLRFLDYFGGQPAADRAIQTLAERLRGSGDYLLAELILGRWARSGQRERAAEAWASLAGLLQDAGNAADAAICYQRLDERFRDTACVDGKTAGQWLAELPADDPIRQARGQAASWPAGAVRRTIVSPESPVPSAYNRQNLQLAGGQLPFYENVDLIVERQHALLVATDGYGRPLWQLPLADQAEASRYRITASFLRPRALGHLLVLGLADRIVAVDPLGTRADRKARIAWSHELGSGQELSPGAGQIRIAFGNLPAGAVRFVGPGIPGTALVMPQAVNEQVVCVTRFRHLMGLDPATGQVLWTRHDLKPGSDVFGDHQRIFIVPPGSTVATVVSARDGAVLGDRPVPAQRLATRGGHVLVWRDNGDEERLALTDPWRQTTLWESRSFQPGAQVELVGEETAAVFEPEGRFVLYAISDGRLVLDQQIPTAAWAARFSLLEGPYGYLLIVHQETPQTDPSRNCQPIGGVPSELLRLVEIHAFDPEGKPLWPAPLTVRDQYLPNSQPRLLPVLVMASTFKETLPNGRSQYGTSVLAIDKRTGQVLCEENFDWRNTCFQLVGDPGEKTVEIRLQKATIRLAFTGQPSGDQTKEAPKTTEAIFQALRHAALGLPHAHRPSHVIAPDKPDKKDPADGPR